MKRTPIHPDPPHLLTIAVTLMILGLLCLGVVFSSGCSVSRTGKSLNVAVGAAKVADQVFTDRAESRGAVEANPILGSQQWRQVVIGGLGVAAVIAGTQAIEKSKPILAHVLRGVAIGIWSAAAIHNGRVGR